MNNYCRIGRKAKQGTMFPADFIGGKRMSLKSQEYNMRRLVELLSRNLSYIYGERESGPNGAKKAFLNTGKTFLRALAKDLGFKEAKVSSNSAGIAVSGECYLYGVWDDGGLYFCLEQPPIGDDVLLYRTIQDINDHRGGSNRFISLRELRQMDYTQLLARFEAFRKETRNYDEWAA